MSGEVKSTETEFQLFDGGHCYMRAAIDHRGYLTFKRFPERLAREDLKALCDWRETQQIATFKPDRDHKDYVWTLAELFDQVGGAKFYVQHRTIGDCACVGRSATNRGHFVVETIRPEPSDDKSERRRLKMEGADEPWLWPAVLHAKGDLDGWRPAMMGINPTNMQHGLIAIEGFLPSGIWIGFNGSQPRSLIGRSDFE